MIRIGIAGIGFMGMIHYLAAQKLRGARVSAICSRDPRKRAGDWTAIRGNFGPAGTQMDLSGIRTYDSFTTMLGDENIDLVDICTPTNQHPEMAIQALRAGRHVLVEKPIALTIADAGRMVEAAQAAGRLLMVGHVLPFFAEFGALADAVRSGRYGQLLAAQFQRIIARPDWSAAIADAAQTGGPAIDLHIHDTHFIRLICGMPSAVFATGHSEGGVADHINAQYCFGAAGPSVACSSGALCQSGRPFMHGYEAYFEGGTLVYQSGVVPPTLFAANGGAERLPLRENADPIGSFANELQSAIDGITASCAPPALAAPLARDALALCRYELESVRTGKLVRVSSTQ